MKDSIFLKIFLNFFIIILLLALFVFAFSFRVVKNHYIKTLVSDLKNLAITLSPEVLSFVEKERFKSLDDFVKRLGSETDTRITIVSVKGRVFADSKKDPALMENHRNRPEIIDALKNGFGYSIRFSKTVKKEMLYVAIPLKKSGKVIAFVRVSLFLRDINRLLDKLKGRLLFIVVAISLLALIFAFLVSKNLSKPIVELAKETEKIAEGNFNVKIDIKRDDEIGLLGKNFVEMAEKLKVLFNDLKLKQQELSNIISSLSEAIVVLDIEDCILFFNKAFRTFFGNVRKGDKIYQYIRSHTFLNLIDEAKKGSTTLKEIVIKGKPFLCSIAIVDENREYIVVLRDISEFKNLEKIKKDFVSNASHELRTPLTAIKGYLETLEDEVSEQGRTFLDIVRRNTDRLTNIVNDLLTLSGIEDRGIEERVDVNLTSILKNVVFLFKQRAEEKGLSLEFKNRIESDAFIKGDPFKLEQAFINLVDNAIKYTDKGKVDVLLEKVERGFLVKVSDTGIGIPEKSIERIFERFYVVDKSRSKSMGGTGLGLSIVKHIVMLHNGDIKVNSKLQEGSSFSVFLPEK